MRGTVTLASLAIVALSMLAGVVPSNAQAPWNAQAPPGAAPAAAPNARAPWLNAGPALVIEAGTHASAVRRMGVHLPTATVITVSDDKSARIWDLRSGALKRVFRASIGPSRIGALHGVAAHPREDLVALGGNTGNLSGGNRILMIRPSDATLVSEFDARGAFVRKLAWSSDASLLLAVYEGQHAVRAFDRDGQVRFEMPLRAPSTALSVAGDIAVAAAADGDILVLLARGGTVVERARFHRPGKSLASVALSPDGQRLAVGYRNEQAAVEILSVRDGRVLQTLPAPRLAAGSIEQVAWSVDGQSIHAAGRGYEAVRNQVAIYRYDARSGALAARIVAARDSIRELEPMADGRLAFGGFDGSWGIVAGDAVAVEAVGALADLRGPENLRISESGMAVTWSDDGGTRFVNFDFDRRLLVRGEGRQPLMAPKLRTGLFELNRWLNERQPIINGLALPMANDELSLSFTYLRTPGNEALVGTQRRLIRVDERGATRWQVYTDSEVRAVNVSADDRLIVTAMADGTLRWWRSSDGAPLVTLLTTRNGRWIAWTPDGYFDASPEADRMIGWAVNRPEASGADFVSLNRFAADRNRPEAIDKAIGVAQRRHVAQAPSTTASQPAPAVLTQVAPPTPTAPAAFPPVARWLATPVVDDGRERLRAPIAYRSNGGPPQIQARFNGRPAPLTTVLPDSTRVAAGERAVAVEMPLPSVETVVQILLSDLHGTSESLTFTYRPLAAAPATSQQPSPAGGAGAQGGATAPTASPVVAASIPERIDIGLVVPATAKPPGAGTASASDAAAAAVRPAALPPPAAGRRKPRLFLLSIGVSDYQRKEYALGLAAKDARDFAEAMSRQVDRLYASVEARVLTNRQASRAGVQEGLDWISGAAGTDDVAILFVAGHGINSTDGRYYFLPHDGDHKRLAETAVAEDRLRRALSSVKGKVLLFVDTCFGGAVISSQGSTELRRMANSLASPENGVIVFASSSGRQESLEKDEWGNGAFTAAILSGLAGKADLSRNGRITYKSLDYYVSEEVSRLTDGKQTPVTITPTGIPDFLVALPST
ncbi:MAG: caspase family protein [Burkholderiaceae bacterium]